MLKKTSPASMLLEKPLPYANPDPRSALEYEISRSFILDMDQSNRGVILPQRAFNRIHVRRSDYKGWHLRVIHQVRTGGSVYRKRRIDGWHRHNVHHVTGLLASFC